MLKNKLYIYILLISFIFCQNIWTGTSVSTSDNLDAFSLNPAGFGLDRGQMHGIYSPVNISLFGVYKLKSSGSSEQEY